MSVSRRPDNNDNRPKKRQRIESPKKKKKRKNKEKKKVVKGKANNSETIPQSRLNTWLKDPCFNGHHLKSTSDPVKNMECKLCNKHYGVSCKNDMKKHCGISGKAGANHMKLKQKYDAKQAAKNNNDENNDENIDNNNDDNMICVNDNNNSNDKQISLPSQPQISVININIKSTEFDFFLSYLSTGIPLSAIVKFINRFNLKQRVKFSEGIPQSRQRGAQKHEMILRTFKQKQFEVIARWKFEDGKYWHWTPMLDEGSVKTHGMMAVLLCRNATDKPLLGAVDFLANSSNNESVTNSLMTFYDESNGVLDRRDVFLILLDDVSYNDCSCKTLFIFFSFMHFVNCPNHSLCNATVEDLIYKSKQFDDVLEFIKASCQLFKNAPKKRQKWVTFRRNISIEIDDDITLDFYRYLGIKELRELADIPAEFSDDDIEQRLREIEVENKNKCKRKKKAKSKKFTMTSYLPNNILEHWAFKLIKNKWLTVGFVVYWCNYNLLLLIKFVYQIYEEEHYFMTLSPENIYLLRMKFAYLLKFVISRYFPMVVRNQGRIPLHHKAFRIFSEYRDSFNIEIEKKDIILNDNQINKYKSMKRKANEENKVDDKEEEEEEDELNADMNVDDLNFGGMSIEQSEDDDIDEDELKVHDQLDTVSEEAMVLHKVCDLASRAQLRKDLKWMNETHKLYSGYLKSRFNDKTKSMKFWAVCQYGDPEFNPGCIPDINCIKFAKNGLKKYENNPKKLQQLHKEWKHFYKIVVPLYAELWTLDKTKPLIVPNGQPRKAALMKICWKLILDGDIIYFWKNINIYELLDLFWIQLLDNEFCNVDVERVMSIYKWVSTSLNEREGPIAKAARMLACWNYDYLKST